MTRYAALLRGANVGGRNRIEMPRLKAALERQGLEHVATYINSGNIVFESALGASELEKLCASLIEAEFGCRVGVGVLDSADLEGAVEGAPDWWDGDPAWRHNALFVLPPAAIDEVYAQVEAAKTEEERIACHGRVIFWSTPQAGFKHERWAQIVAGKAARGAVTIRNRGTVLKLAGLCKKI